MADNKPELLKFLLERVREEVERPEERDRKLKRICRILTDGLTTFDWVGFYLVDPDRRELVLGPFSGEPTQHVRIPFGRGICGQAAESRRTLVVNDVAGESNYLACSPHVRAEIVVPILTGGEMVAQLDIDSHILEAFDDQDRAFAEEVSIIVEEVF